MSDAIELVLATHNSDKVTELRHILDGLGVRLLSAADVALPDVEETGDTFAANALLKARAATDATGLPCVADDSGLVVDALDGAPGIYSARYATMQGHPPGGDTDRANLNLVLERLVDVPSGERHARFVCAAVLTRPGEEPVSVVESMEGRLLREPHGDGGFGYDPIFVPLDHQVTTAEMSAVDKNAISHRGKAFRALRPAIARLASPA